MLVHEILEYTADRLPDKTALIEGTQQLTYREALSRVDGLAGRFLERGITKGDRVALLLPNCIEFCLAYFAVLKLGAIVVPINNRLTPKELAYILNDSGARTLVIGDQYWDAYLSFSNLLQNDLRLICAGESPRAGAEHFAELAVPGPKPGPLPSLAPDDPACIMYTSGTTGVPKGAIMTHNNIFCNARNCGAHLGYRERDVTLVVVPLFHVTGLNSQLVAFFYAGGTCAIMRSYNTGEMIELMQRYKVTVAFMVPTMYTLMLTNKALDTCDISSLRLACYGGAPMDPATIMSLQQRLRLDLINAHGLTETSSVATAAPVCDALRKAGSVGLAATGITLRVVDAEGEDLPPNQVGELWIKGPNVVKAYWNKPDATRVDLADGWLRTGDLARIDPEGFVYIEDRKKDMINRGGENVYSIEVESALVSHPKVLDAAVVPRPHSVFGEVVHAFVIPVPGTEPTEEEIIKHCRALIAAFKVPASVSFLEELPRNPGGKVLKKQLREMVPPGDPPRRYS